jgi:hypothetical protein
MNNVLDAGSSPFSYKTLDELLEACFKFYRGRLDKSDDRPGVHRRREQLAGWVRKFHEECGTLSPQVEESIENLRSGPCVFLMTAHQPNLFAYSGVLRKATLNQVLGEKLAETLKLPVVTFFGLADQDFTNDRWVKSAQLPDVERRDGVLELRLDLPEKMMLCRATKPAETVLDEWRTEIIAWLERNLRSIEHYCRSVGAEFEKSDAFLKNFEGFWAIVEQAYSRAAVLSDFNGFTMSRIVNEVWGYPTLFSRFSECQQIFQEEFSFILSHFGDYSRCLKEAVGSANEAKGGVYELEYGTMPFWYHCDCGSKAKLMAAEEGSFFGLGKCLRCGKEYRIDFGPKEAPEISGIMTRISARGLPMPIIFSDGLGVCCYIGGEGGRDYLRQAKYVAEHMGMTFPPAAIWRPHDVYSGVGQSAALVVFKNLSSTFDFSQYESVKCRLEGEVDKIQEDIKALELQKKQLGDAGLEQRENVERMKALSGQQVDIRRRAGYSLMVRNLRLLQNTAAVMRLHPCIVDYAINLGLGATSEKWISFLRENGCLFSDTKFKTIVDDWLRLANVDLVDS